MTVGPGAKMPRFWCLDNVGGWSENSATHTRNGSCDLISATPFANWNFYVSNSRLFPSTEISPLTLERTGTSLCEFVGIVVAFVRFMG